MTDINPTAAAARESARVGGKFGEQRGINPPEENLSPQQIGTFAHQQLSDYFSAKIGGAFPGGTGRAVADEIATDVIEMGYAPRQDVLLEASASARHIYGAGADAEHQAEQTARYLELLADRSNTATRNAPGLDLQELAAEVGDSLVSTNEMGDGRVNFRQDDNGTIYVDQYEDDDQPGLVTSTDRVIVFVRPA